MSKTKTLFVTGLLALGISGAALADDRFQIAFDNTLKVDEAEGTLLIYLNADGSYTTDQDTAGTWEATETEFCFLPADEPKACVPLDGTERALGESWEVTSSDGARTATFTMVAGR